MTARSIESAAAAGLSIALCACSSTSLSTSVQHGSMSPSAVIRPPTPAATPAAIMVDNALAMLGQPYRYGGAGPDGFDCSGLVVYAAGGAGIRVPRTALDQLRAGRPVARGELRPGDLVFMHLTHKELHVGIAIGGERFVHAPASGGHVRVDSLAAPPYANGYTAARRFADAL